MRHNVWYVFSNKQMKEEFLRNVVNHFGFMISEQQRNAEALMIKSKESSVSLLYRTTVNPDYMTEEIVNYKGEPVMDCGKCVCSKEVEMMKDEITTPVDMYFDYMSKEAEEQRNKSIHDIIKDTELYKLAKDYLECVAKNRPVDATPDDLCDYDSLPATTKKKIDKVREQYNKTMDDLARTCRLVANLLKQADNFDQRMGILEDYDIISTLM